MIASRISFEDAGIFELTLAFFSSPPGTSAVVLDYQVLEMEQRRSAPVGVGYCPGHAAVALPLPSLSVTVVCRNRVRGSCGNNAEHLDSISVYHQQRRHIQIDRERPLQHHRQRSQVQLSMESGFRDIKASQQPTSENACRLEAQPEHVGDRSVGEEQMRTPLIVFNECLDDRDDVGEWRAEMHGIQDYRFD